MMLLVVYVYNIMNTYTTRLVATGACCACLGVIYHMDRPWHTWITGLYEGHHTTTHTKPGWHKTLRSKPHGTTKLIEAE